MSRYFFKAVDGLRAPCSTATGEAEDRGRDDTTITESTAETNTSMSVAPSINNNSVVNEAEKGENRKQQVTEKVSRFRSFRFDFEV